MKTALIVLGVQRSGTSVTSHVLSQLGVNFGHSNHFIQFEHNPIFFELDWVNAINSQIIQQLGYQYTDFFLPVEQNFETKQFLELEQELVAKIEQEWHGCSCIGIKDPRISLTFPIWKKVLSSQGYSIQIIHVFRSPTNFLKSNQKLFHNWKGWTVHRHLNFWLQLNLAAVYFTRHHPKHYVNYDRLMQFPRAEVEQIALQRQLSSSNISDAVQVIQTNHYHYQEWIETGDSWVDECYQKLCEQTLSPIDYLHYRHHMESQLIGLEKMSALPEIKQSCDLATLAIESENLTATT